MSNDYNYDGFVELIDTFEEMIKNTENVIDVLETGAKNFTNDLLKLPKPISKIKKTGYTHLIDCFAYRKRKEEIEVGWGKYYGPMVEHGTVKMKAYSHFYPLWDKNKEKYYQTMIAKLGF